MRRRILIVVLALGTVLGFVGFIARLHHGPGAGGWPARRAAFERHVADICADAALRAKAGPPVAGATPPAQ
jgi:hypothetical protein